MSRIAYIVCGAALIVCAFWYHRHVVDGYKAELAELKGAYADAQNRLIEASVKINEAALYERESKYGYVYDWAKQTTIKISKAYSAVGDVDIDGVIPADVSVALLMQHERICASGACGSSSGDSVQAKTSAGATSDGK